MPTQVAFDFGADAKSDPDAVWSKMQAQQWAIQIERWRERDGWSLRDCASAMQLTYPKLLRMFAAAGVYVRPDPEPERVIKRCLLCRHLMLGSKFVTRCNHPECEGAGRRCDAAGNPVSI